MRVKLLHHTPLYVAAIAIRTAWQSFEKMDSAQIDVCPYCKKCDELINVTSRQLTYCERCKEAFSSTIQIMDTGADDKALIERVGNKFKHSSTLEHLVYTFKIDEFSRATLQELSRHRMASPTVKSTRYTLSELKNEAPFIIEDELETFERASKYVVFTGDDEYDYVILSQLENLRELVVKNKGKNLDMAKFALPEAYKTSEVLTINARSLQNLLSLRTDKSAFWEIRKLARKLYDAIPEDHKFLFKEFVKIKEPLNV